MATTSRRRRKKKGRLRFPIVGLLIAATLIEWLGPRVSARFAELNREAGATTLLIDQIAVDDLTAFAGAVLATWFIGLISAGLGCLIGLRAYAPLLTAGMLGMIGLALIAMRGGG